MWQDSKKKEKNIRVPVLQVAQEDKKNSTEGFRGESADKERFGKVGIMHKLIKKG